MTPSLPVHERPFTTDRFHTDQLPDTPTRTFRIPATGWYEAPLAVLALEEETGQPVEYKRRIGGYLLWRSGPPVGEAVYVAVDVSDLGRIFRFDLHGRDGEGEGPDGSPHRRFRAWKQSLLGSTEG